MDGLEIGLVLVGWSFDGGFFPTLPPVVLVPLTPVGTGVFFCFFGDFTGAGVLVPLVSFRCEFFNCSNRISASALVLTTSSCCPCAIIIY